MSNIGDLYNSLDKYHQFRNKKGVEGAYGIHKRFNKPKAGSLVSSCEDINDWILKSFDFNAVKNVLDAGCGVGGTTFLMAQNSSCFVEGITLSDSELQSAIANKKSCRLNNCSFSLHDMAESLNKKYDLIFALESIKHVPDLSKTILNLSNSLSETGNLIIIEDVATNEIHENRISEVFKKTWALTSVYTTEDYNVAVQNAGVTITKKIDFSVRVRESNKALLYLKYSFMSVLHALLPKSKMKAVVSIFLGGFILEKYYSRKVMKYEALVITKNSENG